MRRFQMSRRGSNKSFKKGNRVPKRFNGQPRHGARGGDRL